jgi:hypothetical protein
MDETLRAVLSRSRARVKASFHVEAYRCQSADAFGVDSLSGQHVSSTKPKVLVIRCGSVLTATSRDHQPDQ